MDQLSSPSLLYSFPTSATINPNQYLLIELPTNKLNNTADGVTLFDQHSNIIDQMQYESSEPGMTWSRKNWNSQIFISTTPTPGSANAAPITTPTPPPQPPNPSPSPSPTTTPQPSPTPMTPEITLPLELLSIYPCPNKSETEWVEIHNPNNNPIDLSNFTLKDDQNNIVKLSGTIFELQSKIINLTKNILNNIGDAAYLFDQSNTLQDQISYSGCTTGQIIYKSNLDDSDTNNSTNSSTTTSHQEFRDQQANSTDSSLSNHNSPPSPFPYPKQNFEKITLSQPSQPPQPKAVFLPNPPIPPKNAIISVILGGMLIVGSGTSLLPEQILKKLLAT